MRTLLKIIIVLTFSLTMVPPTSLSARSCNFPNVDDCKVTDNNKVYQIADENISITGGSNLEVGSMFLSKEKLNLNMKDSKLSLNRIIPADVKYSLNIGLDNSTFIFRNSNSITIEKLTFKDSNNDPAKASVFTVQGFSNVTIDEILRESGSTATLKIKTPLSTLNLKKASVNDVYLTSGYLRIREGETKIDGSIYNLDPEDPVDPTIPVIPPENGYLDLSGGGQIEVLEKGTLTVGDELGGTGTLKASQVHVINGTLNINGEYYIDVLNNQKAGARDDEEEEEESEEDKKADKIINIGEGARGTVSTVRVRDLNLLGEMTVQSTGHIENLNYKKNADGDYVGEAKGTLIFEGKKVPDEEGKINEKDPIPKLTLRNAYLEQLILNDGNIEILRDSEILEIKNDTDKGVINIERVSSMKSNTVQLNNLNLLDTTYNVANSFDVKNLKMTVGSKLILGDTINIGQPLSFESLELGSSSEILVENDGALNIDVSKNLTITNTMLNLNNLQLLGTADERAVLKIGVDKNLIDDRNGSNKFEDGISATGNINLENTDVVVDIQNTSIFNLHKSFGYNVLQAEGGIIWDDILTNGNSNLPEWFKEEFKIVGDRLIVDITRTKDYKDLLAGSNYAGDKNAQNIANTLDKMVLRQYFGNRGVDTIISNIDLKSDIDSIGGNLASLKPIDNNVYIHDVHSNATASLEMLAQNSSYSYLKTKNAESDIMWVRNGFKQGKLNSSDYTDGNKYSSYFAMAGFDIFAVDTQNSYFQIGVAGGFNISDINARSGLYDISSVGYNVALYSNFVTDHFVFSLNTIYMNNVYDSERYSVSDSKSTSSNNVSEILTNVEIATKFSVLDDISYDSKLLKILGVNNLLARPSLFYTNGIINGNKVVEKGSVGYNLGSYSTTIHDAGIGLLLYSTNESTYASTTLQGSYIPYMELKTFYRSYSVPDTVIGFIDMGDDYDINIYGDNKDGVVAKTSFGVDYEKDSHILGLKYSYEHGFKNYSDHGFYLNYKFLLN